MEPSLETPDIGPIGLWNSSGLWNAAGDELAEAAAELDALGYGALWLGSSAGTLQPHESLLQATTRLVVVTGIINVWTDPPALVAESYRRANGNYPDRILIGLGSSHAPFVQTEEYRQPLTRLRRYLDELDTVDPAVNATVPPSRRVLAALGPKTLTLAAQRSAGAHPYLTTPEHTAEAREILGPSVLLAPEQKVILESDPATARAIARRTLSQYLALPNYTNSFLRLGFSPDDFEHGGSDRLIDGLIAWGDTDAVIKRVSEHHAAGADHVCLQVLTASDRHTGRLPRQEWRVLAEALGLRAGIS
jgi:probable F420-dependent oxidoreductase